MAQDHVENVKRHEKLDANLSIQYDAKYQSMSIPSNNRTPENEPHTNALSNEVVVPLRPPRRQTYSGFSTSICDMFRNRFDCCAFACCGILSYDRTRYLLTGERPPPVRNRLFFHLIIPLLIFITAGYCAVYIQDRDVNEAVSTTLIIILVLYIAMDCFLGRNHRILQREEVLEKAGRRGEQNALDLGSAHGFCCGWYNIDGHWGQWDENDNNLNIRGDMCTKLWLFFAKLFWGSCAGTFCQVWGICALAQESREMEMLVEPRQTWIDFVTFEPFSNFYHKIVKLRITQDNSPWAHYKAISKLSKILLKALLAVIVSLIFLSFLKFNTMFTWENVLVFTATFFQAFIILFVVHWRCNKFDLSLDAVIKYFASGFLLTTGIAVFFELIITIVLNLLLSVYVAIIGGVAEEDKHKDTSILVSIGIKHPGLVVCYIFLNSFLLAAFVEELCKYFGYVMVQHPDFMLQETDLLLDRSENVEEGDDVESEYEEEGDGEEEQEEESQNEDEDEVKRTFEKNFSSSSTITAPMRDFNSIGMGITIAMMSVALGFACCENLIYIFVYTGGNVQTELAVLLARSAFPVHPLAAAIQSIHVCRQILEKDETVKVGRIITPSLLLHGSFDFSLMLTAFLYEIRYWKQMENGGNADDEDYGTSVVSFSLALVICIVGTIYFFRESHMQKKRLHQLGQSMQMLIS